MDAHEEQARVLTERLRACRRYNAELNRLEIPPNGDDYNNLLEMLNGWPAVLPKLDGR